MVTLCVGVTALVVILVLIIRSIPKDIERYLDEKNFNYY